MPTICDTHILLFWAHQPKRLTATARQAIDEGRTTGCDLTDPLGDEIDQDRILSDVLGGFFDEVSSHRVRGRGLQGGEE